MSTKDAKKLGSFLKRHRDAQQRSLEAVASAAGMPRSTLLRLERGEFKAPSPEKLQRLARALEVDFEDLFTLAGYATQDELPGLPVYLREKFDDLSDEGVARVERYVEQLRQKTNKGNRRGRSNR